MRPPDGCASDSAPASAAGSRRTPTASPRSNRRAQLLETLGHDVDAVDVPALDTPIDHAFGTVMGVAISRDVARWSARLGHDITPELEPANAFIANSVHVVTAAQYVDALDDMSTWSRALSAWWDDADVLVLPTSPEPPVRLGELAPDNLEGLVRMGALVGFTSPFDLTGQPAISLPLHWNDDRPPDRRPARRALRPRRRAAPPRRAARSRAPVGRPPPTRARLIRTSDARTGALCAPQPYI